MADLRQVWEQQQDEYGDILRQLLGGSPAEVPEHYEQGSPIELLPLGVPQTVIHGTEDRSVPISFSRSYTEAAQEAGDTIELIELDGVDHFAVLYPQLAPWSTILRTVNSLLT
jgi:dipeptidyl aminopeptidase/acylaminoacyl peptidase